MGWYRGLSGGGKVLVAVAGFLAAFAVSFVLALGVLWVLPAGEIGQEKADRQEQPEDTAFLAVAENASLDITRAEWEGDRIEVEGEWTGEVSSIDCDLFEGEDLALVEWWDRTLPVTTSGQTFTQEFVEAGGSIDPAAEYVVLCYAAYPAGLQTSAEKQVEGSSS